MSKIRWRVQEKPTGRFRSFERRGWPDAHYQTDNAELAASLSCADDYKPWRVRSGDHKPLVVSVYDHSRKPWARLTVGTAATLAEAKTLVAAVLKAHPEYAPRANRWAPVKRFPLSQLTYDRENNDFRSNPLRVKCADGTECYATARLPVVRHADGVARPCVLSPVKWLAADSGAPLRVVEYNR